MNLDPLDELLRAYAEQPVPEAPDRLPSRVKQEIERRKVRFPWFGFRVPSSWRESLADPRLSVAGFVCAFAVGVFPAVSKSKAYAQQRLVRQSLHLDVFALGGPGQLKGLLIQSKEEARSQRP